MPDNIPCQDATATWLHAHRTKRQARGGVRQRDSKFHGSDGLPPTATSEILVAVQSGCAAYLLVNRGTYHVGYGLLRVLTESINWLTDKKNSTPDRDCTDSCMRKRRTDRSLERCISHLADAAERRKAVMRSAVQRAQPM